LKKTIRPTRMPNWMRRLRELADLVLATLSAHRISDAGSWSRTLAAARQEA
jgi:hypothetical protein